MCPLTVLKCPLSVLDRCPSYRELNNSKMTEKQPGPTQGVRLKEASVKREGERVDCNTIYSVNAPQAF